MFKSPSAKEDNNIPGLDLDRLSAHLSEHGYALDREHTPVRFAAGFGNMNFLVRVNGQETVLRRPPLGPIPPGANDMAREYRILDHLHPVLPLVPKAKLFCGETEVLGAPFFLMEYRPGLVIGEVIPETVEDNWNQPVSIGSYLGRKVIDVLSDLHAVDVNACGLGDLGKTGDFAARTLRGWTKRAQLSWKDAPPDDLQILLNWLEAHMPEMPGASVLIHNDYKLDNIILNPETLEPRTLIDWDMGTLGDPLYDLAVLLSYWTDADDPEAMQMLMQMPTARPDFPSREEAARYYGEVSGRDLSDLAFHRVLAILRLAVVFQQLYRRFESGGTDDPKYARFDELARGLLRFGVDVAREKYF